MTRILHKLALFSALALPFAAHADTFSFLTDGSAGGFSGSGILTASAQGGGQYLITGISGPGVTGLIAPGLFQGNDNLLFPTAAQLLDPTGFSFTVFTGSDTDFVNIADVAGLYQAIIVDEGGNREVLPITFSLAGTPALTPEPSSILLLGTGALGLAATARHRLKSAASTHQTGVKFS